MTDVSARPEDPLSTTTPDTSAAGRTLAVAAGAAFIAFLDLSVVNIAFPTIALSYPGTSTGTLTWIVSGYAIAFAALLTPAGRIADALRSEEHTSELQSLMRISYAVFCLKKKTTNQND